MKLTDALPDNKIVRGVWLGDRLSNIRKLCIKSFQRHGHEFHLYCGINPPDGIPEGTVIKSIYDVVSMGTRSRFTCDSHYSDYFRVKLIHKLGGWYVDMDEICLRPFDFATPYVFVSEYPNGEINGCMFKAPAGAPFLQWIVNEIDRMDTLNPRTWISVGPELFRRAVPKFSLHEYVQEPAVFDGLMPEEIASFIARTGNFEPAHDDQYSIHLRTSYWKSWQLDPDALYPESPFADLRRIYAV